MVQRDAFDSDNNGLFEMARHNINQAGQKLPGAMKLGVLAAALLLSAGALAWYFGFGGGSDAQNEVPIIRADAGPYKIVPKDPGGMDVPHRDSTVFETLQASAGEGYDGEVEELLPAAEQPLPKDKLFAGLRSDIAFENRADPAPAAQSLDTPQKTAKRLNSIDITAGTSTKSKKEKVEIIQLSEGHDSAHFDKIAGKNASPMKAEIEAKKKLQMAAVQPSVTVNENTGFEAAANAPAQVASASAPVPQDKPSFDIAKIVNSIQPAAHRPTAEIVTGDKSYRVQLGSFRSEADAEKFWAMMQDRFSRELGGLSSYIERINLGDRGTYFRTQSSLITKNEASSICDVIRKERSGGCLVISR